MRHSLQVCIAVLLAGQLSAACVTVIVPTPSFATPTETRATTPSETGAPATSAPAATKTAEPPTVSPTAAPPTATPKPTNTPRPTATKEPTATRTPLPEPITLEGRGDDVPSLDKWSGLALAVIEHKGGGNFAVWTVDSNNEHIDLLVNTIGGYTGTVMFDFLDGQQTTRFDITAGGSWKIVVEPFDLVRDVTVPGTINGNGDDVVFLTGAEPDTLVIDASKARSNFAIWAWNNQGRDLAVNDIAPYQGTVLLPKGVLVLQITAEGPWTIDITSR